MLMTIRYQSGLRVEAVLLAANSERMRVATRGARKSPIEISISGADADFATPQG
jgi:hypothetical protein